MNYIEISPIKVTAIVALTLALFALVSGTFLYKTEHYGSDRILTVAARLVGKTASDWYWRIRFGSGGLLAGAASAFTDGEMFSNGQRTARAVPVLLYHTITERPGPESSDPDVFASQMAALAESGWQTITLEVYESFMRGERSVPEKSFLLTFDDGAKESFYTTDSILAALGFSAVSFVVPSFSDAGGSHYYLAEGEVRTMLQTGRWEVGSHSWNSHRSRPIDAEGNEAPALANRLYLPELGRQETEAEWHARIEDDLARAKAALQAQYGITANSFAFPFGEFGQLSQNSPHAIEAIAEIAGQFYSLSFFQTWPGVGFSYNYPEPGNKEGMLLSRRIEPRSNTDPEELLVMLDVGLPKDLPYKDDLSVDNGWVSVWGAFAIEDGALSMAAAESHTGGAAILDGTGWWSDYRVEMTVTSPRQTGVYLFVRYRGNDDYAGCNFGNGFLHAEELVDGVLNVNNGIRAAGIAIPKDEPFTVEASVRGRTLTCTLNGTHRVATEFLDESLARGGIGVKIWDRDPGSASIEVASLAVEAL